MSITENLLSNLPGRPVPVRDVRIGPFWTLVWTAAGAGLASTMREQHALHGEPVISGAGDLLTHSAQELAQLLRSNSVMERALGMAAVNALLSIDEGRLNEMPPRRSASGASTSASWWWATSPFCPM